MFITTLPKFGLRKLLIRVVLSLAAFIICYFSLRVLFDSFVIPLNQINPVMRYFILSWIFYVPAVIISFLCFYPQKNVLRVYFSSLSAKEIIKDTVILVLISFSISLLLNIIYFSNTDKTEITALLANYKGLQNFFALNIVYFLQWVLVGFAEELIFRAGIYRGLRSVFSRYISLILSAILFVLMHDLHLFPSTFVFLSGIMAAFYFEKRNNLIPIIILHVLQDMYIAGITLYLSAYIVNLF